MSEPIYRLKTKEEFTYEYGRLFHTEINGNWSLAMKHLFGIQISKTHWELIQIGKYDKESIPILINGQEWYISKDMVKEDFEAGRHYGIDMDTNEKEEKIEMHSWVEVITSTKNMEHHGILKGKRYKVNATTSTNDSVMLVGCRQWIPIRMLKLSIPYVHLGQEISMMGAAQPCTLSEVNIHHINQGEKDAALDRNMIISEPTIVLDTTI